MDKHIVIIGNGIAGITAARHIRKLSNHKITVISAETDHFYSRTALMYIYMGHMRYKDTKPYEDWFWAKNRIDLLNKYVQSVKFDAKTLEFSDGGTLSYDTLVFATGSKPNKFGWKGQDLDGVQGLYSYQDLELMEQNTLQHKVKSAVIIGGGLIGVEMAEMLLYRDIKVTFLIREDKFWGGVLPREEGDLVRRHLEEHHVTLKFNTELDEIVPNKDGRVSQIITKNSEKIECEFVGLTAGVRANIDFLRDTELDIDRGIKVNKYLETNIKDVYAIGDCVQVEEPVKGRRKIEQVWYVGRMMGEVLAQTICKERTAYTPGPFMANLRTGEEQFYWEHKDGKKCLKMVFDKASKRFIGLNVFGIRLRHHLLNKWLQEERDVEYVLSQLKNANFDPEFYSHYEQEIIDQYNKTFNAQVKPKKKSFKEIFFVYTL